MQVKILVTRIGTDGRRPWVQVAGETVDLPEGEALTLIGIGQAVAVGAVETSAMQSGTRERKTARKTTRRAE